MYVIIDMKNICLVSGFNIPVKKRYLVADVVDVKNIDKVQLKERIEQ